MKFKTIALPVLFLCIFLTFLPHVLQAGPGEGWGLALGNGPLKPLDANTGPVVTGAILFIFSF